MRNLSGIYLFCAIALCPACTKLLALKEGLKNPKLETHKSLSNYLAARQIDTVDMLCFKDTTALKQFYKQKIGIPDACFFNRQGQFVDYRESPDDCNGKVAVFIEKMDALNSFQADDSKKIQDYLSGAVWSKDHTPFEWKDKGYDAYLVMYWAKYVGKVNKRKVFDWQTLVKEAEQKGVKVKVLTVSADYQSFWGMKQSDVPTLQF